MRGERTRDPQGRGSRSGLTGSKDPSEIRLNYTPHPKQNLFHKCEADVLLYGGQAGGGKSAALLMDALISVIEIPGNTAMLMRRTYPELEASLIKRSLELFPKEFCKYNDAKHRWTIDTGHGPKSYVLFGHCERDRDVYKHLSSEWGYLGIDESTSFTEFMITMLYGRVRSPLAGAYPRMRLCTNPGGIGHGYHRKYFGIGTVAPLTVWRPPKKPADHSDPPSRCFIPAGISDNPSLEKNDPGYRARLEALPEAQRKMFLLGEWEGFAGQYFTEFDKAKHVIKPFAIPRHWKLYRSVDFGSSKPFSCHWHAIDDKGHAYTFREAYKAGLRDKEQAKLIKKMSVRINPDKSTEEEIFEFTVGDPAMARKSSDTGISIQMNYDSQGITIFPGSNSRISGWMAVRNWLAIDPATGTPWWQIFDTCHDLIRELEEAITDENNPEDLNSDGSDHALDDSRYFFMARPAPPSPLQKDDGAGRLDAGSRSEWDAVNKMTKQLSEQASKARSVLNGFND